MPNKLATGKEKLLSALVYVGLAVVFLFFIYFAQIYLTLTHQFAAGWGIVFILFILQGRESFKNPPLRIVFIILSVFLTVRYLLWRTTDTLVYTGPADFIAMAALYLAEVYAIIIHLLGVFSNIWPLESKIQPLPVDTARYPSVDVLIPTYNEPLELVKITATAARNIDYPQDKLKIYILDDGATVAKRNDPKSSQAAWERHYSFRRLAGELGINYLTRETNQGAKAGNINHGLRQSRGDLVLILDCDHVPARDILKNTVGWFIKDEKVALVQTPHFFINPTPIEKSMALFNDAPTESDMFYRINQPGLDLWNSSFFCGSAGILKRNALEEIGGISGETITEDCETALLLHGKGYRSIYISRPMVCGLSPESFDDFIRQRTRWSQGMTQVFILNNPLFARGLKFYQRLCYFNNCSYWFFGLSRLIFYIAPAAFLLFKLQVIFASVGQVMIYALPHVAASIILMNFLYGNFRWPLFSELFESVQSLFLMPAIFSVLVNPKKPSFKVTPKERKLERESLSGSALPFLLLCAVLIAALVTAVVKWFKYPLYHNVIIITFVWCLFNLLLAMASLGAFLEKRQMRRHHRMWARARALLFFPRLKKRVEARLEDISLSGIAASFKPDFSLLPGEEMVIEMRDSYGARLTLHARLQRQIQKGERLSCGIEFIIADEKQYAAAVNFVYGDSQRWVDFWGQKTKEVSLWWSILFFFISGLKGFKISIIMFLQFFLLPLKNFFRLLIRGTYGSVSSPSPLSPPSKGGESSFMPSSPLAEEG